MYDPYDGVPEPLFEVQEAPNYEAPSEDEHLVEPLEYEGPAADRCPRPLQYAVLEKFERVLMSGPVTSRAVGLIGSPPCETRPAARWLELRVADRYRPLAPLRTLKHRWGRPDVSARQHQQLSIGSQLLLSQHQLMLTCLE
eukprot:711902-Pyramimonas_sp.AAC.1